MTSVREIADACDIGMGTLYRYFGSKNDILNFIIEQGKEHYAIVIERISSRITSMNALDAIKHAITEYYRYVQENWTITAFANQWPNLTTQSRDLIMENDNRIISVFESLLIAGVKAGEFTVDNTHIAAHSIVINGQTWALRRRFLSNIDPEKYIDEQIKLILRGLSCNNQQTSGIV